MTGAVRDLVIYNLIQPSDDSGLNNVLTGLVESTRFLHPEGYLVFGDRFSNLVVQAGSEQPTGITFTAEGLGLGGDVGYAIFGGHGENDLTGSNDRDFIAGGQAADVFHTTPGADVYAGDNGTDTLVVADGHGGFTFIGGDSVDADTGLKGRDTVNYAALQTGIFVHGDNTRLSTSNGDLLYSVEKTVGTDYDDRFVIRGSGPVGLGSR